MPPIIADSVFDAVGCGEETTVADAEVVGVAVVNKLLESEMISIWFELSTWLAKLGNCDLLAWASTLRIFSPTADAGTGRAVVLRTSKDIVTLANVSAISTASCSCRLPTFNEVGLCLLRNCPETADLRIGAARRSR